ncbi:TOPRIM nucleotidyl transferase/hydrolase domain-containing protein [Marinobacterium rhizophilum]|uniref:TOPRIM nucleotidyl transferase/hydrolase domain-containing protein n=1 Tax=Marinobacterium rhizophilum TaxID=420402 RepID=UPI0003796690|nr:TOPRIM nucleotidyl transferase/hydrolase domain-containing protein [Marinobacterium rhizophilum]
MGTTIEDIQYEEMWSELHFEAVMKNEAKKQCIYIFVEGHSEEVAIQPLLEDCGLNFETDGIVVANYNGIGNLKHAIRLLRKTLSHDRPIIVTFDDDIDGKRISNAIHDPLITTFKIPYSPLVTYSNGEIGGSFEESFTPDCFIESSFKPRAIDSKVVEKETDFRNVFNPSRPWVSQLASFISSNGGNPDSINKVEIAKNMVESCSAIPKTFEELAKLVRQVRITNPIKHPDDVEVKI